jgi:predicted nucleic acid-binding protein
MYLLDTNVVSELRRHRPHGGVIAWINSVRNDSLHLAAVTLGEIQIGIEKTRGRDAAKAAELEVWLDELSRDYNALSMDGRAFRAWARLMHGRSADLLEDAMIAAIATTHQLIVATRNVRDFGLLGVPTLNPFETA